MTAIMTDAENAASCGKGEGNRCGFHVALRSPESVVTTPRCTCRRIFRIWSLFAEGIQRYYKLDGWQAPALPVGSISRIPIEIRGERASQRVSAMARVSDGVLVFTEWSKSSQRSA